MIYGEFRCDTRTQEQTYKDIEEGTWREKLAQEEGGKS